MECNIGDTVVAIKERTFNKITIYGFGELTKDGVNIDGKIVKPYEICHIHAWQELVDSTDAIVERFESFCLHE